MKLKAWFINIHWLYQTRWQCTPWITVIQFGVHLPISEFCPPCLGLKFLWLFITKYILSAHVRHSTLWVYNWYLTHQLVGQIVFWTTSWYTKYIKPGGTEIIRGMPTPITDLRYIRNPFPLHTPWLENTILQPAKTHVPACRYMWQLLNVCSIGSAEP